MTRRGIRRSTISDNRLSRTRGSPLSPCPRIPISPSRSCPSRGLDFLRDSQLSLVLPAGISASGMRRGPTTSTAPTFSFPVNQPTGNPRFIISEGPDVEDGDPYGHIHDRAWTADKPGDYFRDVAVCRRQHEPSGWWVHGTQPSQTYVYHFKAGPEFSVSGQMVTGAGFCPHLAEPDGDLRTRPIRRKPAWCSRSCAAPRFRPAIGRLLAR